MKANIGLILAAGKQTRFNNEYPKSLMLINDTCLLDINYKIMKKCCEQVYVVCNFENEHYFDDKKYKKIVINSGYGSGDAVLRALNVLKLKEDDIVFIAWGDALIDMRVYFRTLKEYGKYDIKTFIPCMIEENPYVQLFMKNKHLTVLFSKYGDKTSRGYHDMCLFLGNAKEFQHYLNIFKQKFFNNDTKQYEHKHGNEFEFLDVFNDTNIKALLWPIIEDEDLKTYTFNTREEFEKLFKMKGD